MTFGEALAAPYQLDWYGLTHPFYRGTEGFTEIFGGVTLVFAIGAYATVGAVVATLRPKNGVGWLCLALSLLIVLVAPQPGLSNILDLMQSLAWHLTVPPLPVTLMLLIFPDGRFRSRRWWAVVGIALAGYTLTFLGVYLPGDYAHVGLPVGVWISLFALLASVVGVVLRWRRSRDQERQQLKWLVYMVALTVVAGFGGLASGYVSGAYSYIAALGTVVVAAGVRLGIPVAIGVAVLRYRLYDIEVVINRTLVYGALTATLVAAYFGGIVLLQRVFVVLASQKSTLAVVASTS